MPCTFDSSGLASVTKKVKATQLGGVIKWVALLVAQHGIQSASPAFGAGAKNNADASLGGSK